MKTKFEHLDYWIQKLYKGHNKKGIRLSNIDCGEIMQLLIQLDKKINKIIDPWALRNDLMNKQMLASIKKKPIEKMPDPTTYSPYKYYYAYDRKIKKICIHILIGDKLISLITKTVTKYKGDKKDVKK